MEKLPFFAVGTERWAAKPSPNGYGSRWISTVVAPPATFPVKVVTCPQVTTAGLAASDTPVLGGLGFAALDVATASAEPPIAAMRAATGTAAVMKRFMGSSVDLPWRPSTPRPRRGWPVQVRRRS